MRILSLSLLAAMIAAPAFADNVRVYIGTYTGKSSKGIYQCEFDTATGKLTKPELAAEAPSPSFLAIHPNGKFLYAVGEVNEFEGQKGGVVLGYAIDAKSGGLTKLNGQSSKGAGPCHLNVDRTGKYVLVANYTGGSTTILPIGADGKLAPASGFIQHEGSSVNKSRQSAPHAHSVNLDPAGKFAFVADLGLDKVLIYKLDAEKGTIAANEPAAVNLAPGDGPRHFAFHPSGKYAFVINEMTSTLTALAYDAEKGSLTKLGTESTLPDAKPVKGNSTAEVVVHPSGKFVYGSNRGHNSIAVFAFDEKTGKLTPASHQGEGIKTPRNFNIDPSGKFLLVANQAGNSMIVFAIDQATGALKPTGNSIEVGSPVCIRFLGAAK